MAAPSRPLTALLLIIALLAASCGGDDAATPDGTAAPPTSTTVSAETDPPPADTVAPTTAPEVTTTTEPACEPAAVAPEDIHELVVAWAEGTTAPLPLAVATVGFPFAVPVPEGSVAHNVSVRLNTRRAGEAFAWDWSYDAFAPGPVGDVDITLEDNGAGAVELRDTFDPILADLGWSYSNSTGSDPGERGGPNSINHVYRSDAESILVSCDLPATPSPLFVWLEEDLVFGDDEQPGYQIDAGLDFAVATIPVPILDGLARALPEIPGAELVSAQLRSLDRPADSFAAAEGLRYLDAELVLSTGAAADPSPEQILSTELDGVVLRPGEESFFDEGTIELVEPTVQADEWRLPVIVVGRYEGTLTVAPDPDDGGRLVTLEVRMEPNREMLAPPVE